MGGASVGEPPRVERPLLLPAQRRQRIGELLHAGQVVRVDALSQALGVSEVTVRRDLSDLQRRGLLERTYGGAMSTRPFGAEPRYVDKQRRCAEEKRRIGALAASLVGTSQTVLLNSGTTTLEVAAAIARRDDLLDVRLATVNLTIPREVHADWLEILLLGGQYREQSNSLLGPLTGSALTHVAADVVFLGVDGIHARFGITTPNPGEAAVARAMIERCHGSLVVVADHTKVGAVAGAVSAPLQRITHFVTDSGADPDALEELRRHGLQVLIA